MSVAFIWMSFLKPSIKSPNIQVVQSTAWSNTLGSRASVWSGIDCFAAIVLVLTSLLHFDPFGSYNGTSADV